MTNLIGAGIFGCGGISENHLSAINSITGVEPILLFDIKKERAEARAAQFGGTPAESFGQVLDDPRVKAVHILTPHALHAGQALMSLSRGKYVLCEKPMATTLADAKRLMRADPEARRLCVIFQNRYNKSTEMAKRIISEQTYGKIITIKAEMTWHRDAQYYSDDWHGTQALECGGVLINQAIHTIDLMLYLGGAPEAVKGAVTTDLLEGVIEVEENAHAVVKFKSGIVGLLYASNSFGISEKPTLRIVCETGTLVLNGSDLLLERGSECNILVRSEGTATLGKAVYGDSHIHQISEFYRCIRNEEPFKIGAREAYNALWAVLSIYESSRTGRWVRYESIDLSESTQM
ncbi:MAG: Gfo/Idh/MocA family oxidoreductase [Oscillospiraceae bacterium]|jgi:predicted dehydrogenase|nr:Gfo/Idh/MocA family oxidoreductase [Oscillospiraceae bacterium]